MSATAEDIRLMQQEIDGANTPAESAGLRAKLKDDAEARAMFEELQRVARAVEDLAVPAPPALRRAILDAVGLAPAPAPARSRPGAWRSAFWPGRVAALRYAAVLVAGVALGLLGGRWLGPHTDMMPPASVSGTLAPAGTAGGGTWQVDLQGLRGVVRWEQAPPVVVLDCDLRGAASSSGPAVTDMVIQYDPAKARFAGFEQAAPEGVALRLDEGRVSIEGPFRAPFTLRFARTAAGDFGATVTFQRAGETLGTRELTVTAEE